MFVGLSHSLRRSRLTENKETRLGRDRPSGEMPRQGGIESPRDIVRAYDPSEPTVVLRFPGQTELSRRQYTVETHYYDSLAWMKTALQKDRESGRSDKQAPTNLTELKVGQVSCGLAIELAYKALLYSQDKPHSKRMESHDASKLHRMVDQPDRAAIEAVGEVLLKDDSSSLTPRNGVELIKYIADNFTNPDVKYWGRKSTAGKGTPIPGIPTRSDEYYGTISAIQKVHCKILDLARRRTWPYNWRQFQADASQDESDQYSGIVAVRIDSDDETALEMGDEWITKELVFELAARGIHVPPEFYQDDLSDNR